MLQRRFTVISFCVRVPVLSEQITFVQPKVSTAESFLTKAFSFAIFCTATASDSVTAGNSPSGMNATTIPSANRKDCIQGSPTANTAMRKNTSPMPKAISAICFVKMLSSFCKGDSPFFVSCVRRAILPNSLSIPVDTTRARHVPAAALVPENTIFSASRYVHSFLSASPLLRIGLLSPVNVDWSALKSLLCKIRASALILSPSSSIITSPGTTSAARILTSSPPRTTRT